MLGYAGGALLEHLGWSALLVGVGVTLLLAAAIVRRW